LIGNFVVFVTVHFKYTVPVNLSDSTSLPSKPDPIPEYVPFALTRPPKSVRVSIADIPPGMPHTVPMPAPEDEPLAVIFPLTIVIFPIFEIPPP
jgi:hypothetical protein